MTNYREILRLHSLGLNKTEISSSCQCARNTVAATLQRAANCGLQWPLPEEMSDKQLSERRFPSSASKPVYKMQMCIRDRFNDVTFAYHDKEVLHHISFAMKKNSMTALVGPSGSGKSTIEMCIRDRPEDGTSPYQLQPFVKRENKEMSR